jgi:hypothetical protein
MSVVRLTGVYAVLLTAVAVPGCSQSKAKVAKHPATINEFLKQYVSAINSRDIVTYRSLLHPKSLACITPESNDYYDRAFRVNMRHPIPADYKFEVKPVGNYDKLGFEGYAVFPIRPAQLVQIEYSRGAENTGEVIFWLLQDQGGWAEIFPCATQETIKRFNAEASERKANEEKTQSLVASIKEPLRSELVSLLKQGKSSTAATRYAEATGQDHTTAMFVVEEMEYQLDSAALAR